MARSWTRLHEHLGHRPGPLTYEMVAAAVADKLPESDDLDWKERLPAFAPKPGIWNEFAKDVAAMANTRGGLLVYGVSDQIDPVGVDLASADKKQMLSAVRNGIQPFISGVDFVELPAPGGTGPDFLVVDVPPSEMAPHFQYGWEQKDKDRVTFNAPYRINDDTFYMREHQVARAYQDRFARQNEAGSLLKACLEETSEVVLSESEGKWSAWLVIAARTVRPVPRMVPAPSRAEAKDVLLQAVKSADRIKDAFDGPPVLAHALNNDMRVGLRRWVDSSFLTPHRDTDLRPVMVELHHDATVTVSADLSHNMAETNGVGIAVNTQTLSTVVREAVAVANTLRLHLAPDSPLDITAIVTVPGARAGQRLLPLSNGYGAFNVVHNARHPRRLLPSSTELAPNADDEALLRCAHQLSSGLLHQFGINTPL